MSSAEIEHSVFTFSIYSLIFYSVFAALDSPWWLLGRYLVVTWSLLGQKFIQFLGYIYASALGSHGSKAILKGANRKISFSFAETRKIHSVFSLSWQNLAKIHSVFLVSPGVFLVLSWCFQAKKNGRGEQPSTHRFPLTNYHV